MATIIFSTIQIWYSAINRLVFKHDAYSTIYSANTKYGNTVLNIVSSYIYINIISMPTHQILAVNK